MKNSIERQLKKLPMSPGVYFHKDSAGKILYIGKAANLRNRVRQYFQKSRIRDPKTDALVAEIADIEWREVETELDALFLEAELIRRYLPPYNIMLRDDKSLAYVRINIHDPYPSVTITRRPLDDKAEYLGPYYSSYTLRRALKALRKVFPYSTHTTLPKRACLQAHLGLCPGIEANMTPISEYKANLKKLMRCLRAERASLIKDLTKEMKENAANSQFEKAAKLRDQIMYLKRLAQQIVFSDSEQLSISKDHALIELQELIGLKLLPKRIEGYDISHMQGTDNVASMVVFRGGIPDKSEYRKFKLRIPGNDDFVHMNEAITRRLKQRYVQQWGKPDLILIDGGKGQLKAAQNARDAANSTIPMVGLAKREEEIIVSRQSKLSINYDFIKKHQGHVVQTDDFLTIQLPKTTHLVKLLQRIRDESHRFAVSYHTTLKQKRQIKSILDDIPGVGPATKKKLLGHFGSFKQIVLADKQSLKHVVGDKLASVIKKNLQPYKDEYQK